MNIIVPLSLKILNMNITAQLTYSDLQIRKMWLVSSGHYQFPLKILHIQENFFRASSAAEKAATQRGQTYFCGGNFFHILSKNDSNPNPDPNRPSRRLT